MIDQQQSVASLVLDHSECAAVLQRHRIDYCCHGEATLAAHPRLIDLDEIVAELGEILEAHIDDEEKTLFPALTADEPDRPRLAALLSAMRDDHAAVGELLGRMRTATLFRELAELVLPRFVRPAPRWRA